MKLDRTKYETDDAFYTAMVEGELQHAKEQRWSLRYGDDRFQVRVTLVGPYWECAHIPAITWKTDAVKHELMQRIAFVAKVTNAKAIMLSADSRWLEIRDFCEHFKITPPQGSEDVGRVQREYHRIIAQHEGKMENLPRHIWAEGVHAALKTPAHVYFRMAPYTRGSAGKVMWVPPPSHMRSAAGVYQANIIPDWWGIPDDHPGVRLAGAFAQDALNALLNPKKGAETP